MNTTSRRPRVALATKHRQQNHEEWKESLRQACFNRARKNRRDLIWKKRHQHTGTSDEGMVRSVVEQELRQQGVAVVTPGKIQQPFLIKANENMAQLEPENSNNEEEYALSQEELYDLLQEVEAEMRRSEEELLEEVLERERCQQEDIEQQIAEFEEWEEYQAMQEMDEEECVVCPICCESVLQKFTTIACPNEACPLKIGIHYPQDLTLADLKEKLRSAFEEHSYGCDGTLSVEFATNSGQDDFMQEKHQLTASCFDCNTIVSII